MIDKDRLLGVAGLNLSGQLEKMNESQLEAYAHSLNSFVEAFPRLDANIKSALTAKDYDALSKHIEAACEMLNGIYANDLAKDCLAQTGGLHDQDHEKLEAYLTDFTTTVSTLSIDIQMAEYKEKDEPSGAGAESGGTILAVDDAAFFLNRIKGFLQDTPYKLVCMTSATTALRFLESNKPNLFILDIDMPEMDGYELIKRIRQAGHTAPVIFLTGNATRDYVVKAIKAGAADFLVKPASREQVLDRIGKFI
ncbi:MAG: response regulator [Oscillospiraceae bacterium]|jgi:CheY-like chemotaxis protein|nr:response regulator [Oscillospiraceae bacterium]